MATGSLTNNTTDNKWELTVEHGKITTADSIKTLLLSTAGTYLDKDIEITTTATKPDAGAFKATDVTIPSANITIGSTATSGTYPINIADTTINSTATTSGYITSGSAGETGTASGTGSVTQSTLKNGTTAISTGATVTPSTSQQTINIGAGYYPSARTVTVDTLQSAGTATVSAVAASGWSGQTDSAGTGKIILASDGALKISSGYVENDLYYSLAGLVPDEATLTASEGASYILDGQSAYDKDGKLITGTIGNLGNPSSTYYATTAGESASKITAGKYTNQDLYIKSGSAGTPSASVTASVGSWALQTSGTNSGKYTATISGTNTSGATVTNTTGWITGSTKTGTATASGTAVLDAATCTIEGGTITATAGTASASASCESVGMTNGVSSTATSYYVTASAEASATGGSAKITDVTDTHTAGYLPAKDSTTVITGSSKTGASTGTKSDSQTVYLKAAELTHSDVSGTAGSVTATVATSYITTTTTANNYKITFTPTEGTISCTSSVSAGYTEGDSKTATITATPTAPSTIYLATTSLTNSVTATKGGANNTSYNAPVTTTSVSTSIPQVVLTGSGSGTTKRILTSNGTAAVKYINYYTGSYTLS